MGLICNRPTETFVDAIYRGLDARDRHGSRDLPAAFANTVKEETCMMKRCVNLCLKSFDLGVKFIYYLPACAK